MALLDEADRQAMLEAIGKTADVAGGSLTVVFSEPGQVLDAFEGQIMVQVPTALAADADVEAYSLVGDPDGSSITINNNNYVIKDIIPDGDGFSLLELRDA